jgi:hypothetical protein
VQLANWGNCALQLIAAMAEHDEEEDDELSVCDWEGITVEDFDRLYRLMRSQYKEFHEYIKVMLQANKFNKHPILTINVIECFYKKNTLKITIQISSIKYYLFKKGVLFCSLVLKIVLLLIIMNKSNFRIYFIE